MQAFLRHDPVSCSSRPSPRPWTTRTVPRRAERFAGPVVDQDRPGFDVHDQHLPRATSRASSELPKVDGSSAGAADLDSVPRASSARRSCHIIARAPGTRPGWLCWHDGAGDAIAGTPRPQEESMTRYCVRSCSCTLWACVAGAVASRLPGSPLRSGSCRPPAFSTTTRWHASSRNGSPRRCNSLIVRDKLRGHTTGTESADRSDRSNNVMEVNDRLGQDQVTSSATTGQDPRWTGMSGNGRRNGRWTGMMDMEGWNGSDGGINRMEWMKAARAAGAARRSARHACARQ